MTAEAAGERGAPPGVPSPPAPPSLRRTDPRSLLAYGGGAGVIVLLLVAFLFTSASPYRFVSEVVADPAARNQTVYVAAFIADGSLRRSGDVTTLVATDGLATMPVVYRGPLPGILKEDTGVTLIGRMGADGTFVAYQLLAKCPSKYEEVIRSRLGPKG